MKKVLLCCALLSLFLGLMAQSDTLNILVIGAHPDDNEISRLFPMLGK